MVNINDAYSGYLSAENLQGQPINVTISHVEIKEFDDGKKGCVFFHGFEKGVLLNVTNKNTIVEMFGPETDNWTGQIICMFPSTTDFRGKIVPCIRFRRPEVGAHNQQGPVPQYAQQPLPTPTVQQMPEAKPQDFDDRNPPPRDDIPF